MPTGLPAKRAKCPIRGQPPDQTGGASTLRKDHGKDGRRKLLQLPPPARDALLLRVGNDAEESKHRPAVGSGEGERCGQADNFGQRTLAHRIAPTAAKMATLVTETSICITVAQYARGRLELFQNCWNRSRSSGRELADGFRQYVVLLWSIQNAQAARMAPRTSTNFAVLDESITVWGVVLPAIFAGAQSSSVAELAWLCGLALCAEVCRQKLFESSAAIVTARHSPKRAAEWVGLCYAVVRAGDVRVLVSALTSPSPPVGCRRYRRRGGRRWRIASNDSG